MMTCTGVRIQFAKGKDRFSKDNIVRYIDLTFKPLMHVTIAQKHTLLRLELRFVSIERSNIWSTCTTKDS
jgi:hypothetical protein